jgi:hypothetical protein
MTTATAEQPTTTAEKGMGSNEARCDASFREIGLRLNCMTRSQYQQYSELLSDMSAVMTGIEAPDSGFNREREWAILASRAHRLAQAIDANAPGTDTSHLRSSEDELMPKTDRNEESVPAADAAA